MLTFSTKPIYIRIIKLLALLAGIAVCLAILGYKVLFVYPWLGYLFLGMSVCMLLGLLGIGLRWLHVHPRLTFSAKGIIIKWPWRKRFIHWREVLQMEGEVGNGKVWLLGNRRGYRITYGLERQFFFLPCRYEQPESIQKWMNTIMAQLPLSDVAMIEGLPLDKTPSAPKRAYVKPILPKVYSGPLLLSPNLLFVCFLWGVWIYVSFFSFVANQEGSLWLSVPFLVLTLWMCYTNFSRFTLTEGHLHIRKSLWPSKKVLIPLDEIEQVHFERKFRQPRSLVVHCKDGSKRRFVSSILWKRTWRELVYDLAGMEIFVDLNTSSRDLLEK